MGTLDQLKHRKAKADLRILNPDGSPAVNIPVKTDQISHSFLFGCGAFDTVSMLRSWRWSTIDFLSDRMEKWLDLFNYATLPFYWEFYEPSEGQTAYKEILSAAKWLRERGVRLKGHPLCWHNNCPGWLSKYSNSEIADRQIERIHREVETYKGIIDIWDVVNEAVIMPTFTHDNPITRFCREEGRLKLIKDAFTAAKNSNPDAMLLINDYSTGAKYEMLIEELLDADVPISAIGIQSHQHRSYWGLEKLQQVLDRFSRFGLPIHFTENSLLSGNTIPNYKGDLSNLNIDSWPSTPDGEERQAKELAEFYIALFSHPLVEAITAWEFTDGQWLKAPSGLLRKDNSEKPSYRTLENLIHGTWETHEAITTDAEGYLSFTGFKGSYRLSSEAGSAELELKDDVRAQIILNENKRRKNRLSNSLSSLLKP